MSFADPEKRRQYNRRYYRENAAYFQEYRRVNHTKRRAQISACQRKRRQAVLAKFGLVCASCGFSDTRALQIDHKNGGGSAERHSFKAIYTYYSYLLDEANPVDYQTLCANCNVIKQRERGEY